MRERSVLLGRVCRDQGSVDVFPFHADVLPDVSFIEWPYDDYHQPANDLTLIDHGLIDYLSEIGCAATRLLANADPM